MEKLTQWITENPVVTTWITIISLLGVAITVIALIIQIKDKKRKAIFYSITTNVLLDNKVSMIDGIRVTFHDEEVRNIAISTVKIWNGGNELLEASDFYSGKELKLEIPINERILAAKVLDETEDTCKVNATIAEQNNAVQISFYCLEPKQGATINIYHTNIEEDSIYLIGRIKGGKLINRSVSIETENGEVYISTGKYRINLDGGLLSAGLPLFRVFSNILGVSIIKDKR